MMTACSLTTGICHSNKQPPKKPKSPQHLCPFCSAPISSQCRCVRSDMTCPNGHTWHRCPVHKTIVVGTSDHSQPMDQCSCRGKGLAGSIAPNNYWKYLVIVLMAAAGVYILAGS